MKNTSFLLFTCIHMYLCHVILVAFSSILCKMSDVLLLLNYVVLQRYVSAKLGLTSTICGCCVAIGLRSDGGGMSCPCATTVVMKVTIINSICGY